MFNKTARGGAGDTRWITSSHGLPNAKTEAVTVADFAAQVVNGVLPSGTALTITGDTVAPYDGATLSGFVAYDQAANADVINVPVIKHGIIDASFLPDADFAVPTNPSAFVFHVAPAGGE